MAFTNSPLVNYTRISPNRTVGRNHAIDTLTIHCVVGQCSVQTLGAIFAPVSRQASSNYGIGYDGKIGMYCEEKDRSWCSSSASNDHRAITIEVASDTTYPYAVNDKAYAALIELCADICKRNGIKELKWQADKSLIGQTDKQNMTAHRWFAATACPGEFLYSRFGQIAEAVNKKLGVAPSSNTTTTAFNKGDTVQFLGGKHFKSSSALTGTSVKASKAKITAVSANAKHPYHLRAVNDSGAFISGVYGWVDADCVSAVSTSDGATVAPTPTPTPAPASSSNIIKKGSVVSISNGAKYYGTKTAVPQWVRAKQWIVMEDQKGDRVVVNKSTDGKSAICSAISSAYLTVVSGGATNTSAPATATAVIKKGSKVKVRSGAKTYTGGKLASFVYKTTYSVLEEPKGDRVVIGINGVVTAAVNKNDLTLV